MTNENNARRRWWVGAAVAVLAAAVIGRELIRTGRMADGLLSHWYGDVALTAIAVAAAGTGLYLLNRAYRR